MHYATYQFIPQPNAALASKEFKALVKDFENFWPKGVTCTRDIVTLVEECDT